MEASQVALVVKSKIPWSRKSSILAWKIPWAEETGGLQSIGSHRVEHNWSDLTLRFMPTNAKMNNGPTTKEAYFTHIEAWAGWVFPISSLLCFTWRCGDVCFLPFCASVIPQGSGSPTVHKAPHGSKVNSQNHGELSLKCEGITAILGISWIQYLLLATGSFAQH